MNFPLAPQEFNQLVNVQEMKDAYCKLYDEFYECQNQVWYLEERLSKIGDR